MAFKKIKKITRIEKPDVVYNLHIENNHNYVANGMVVSNCHLADNTSITKIIEQLNNTRFRYGFTGTLSEAKVHELKLTGLFGPKIQTVTTKQLMKNKVVSTLDIQVRILSYSKEDVKIFKQSTSSFFEETKWITQHQIRNLYISNIALKNENNTLILFNYIEHGETLFKIINKAASRFGKRAFLIYGDTPPAERELVRVEAESSDDVIIIASSALFSTGVNIKNLHSIIFSHSFKAKIRNLQSIGRGLRLNNNKSKAVVYDIADNLSAGSRPNFSMLHLEKRLQIYQSEQFDYTIKKAVLPFIQNEIFTADGKTHIMES